MCNEVEVLIGYVNDKWQMRNDFKFRGKSKTYGTVYNINNQDESIQDEIPFCIILLEISIFVKKFNHSLFE